MLLYNKRKVKNKWTIKTKYSTHGCKDMKKKKKKTVSKIIHKRKNNGKMLNLLTIDREK